MPSSAAVFSALASALVGVHRSGYFQAGRQEPAVVVGVHPLGCVAVVQPGVVRDDRERLALERPGRVADAVCLRIIDLGRFSAPFPPAVAHRLLF